MKKKDLQELLRSWDDIDTKFLSLLSAHERKNELYWKILKRSMAKKAVEEMRAQKRLKKT